VGGGSGLSGVFGVVDCRGQSNVERLLVAMGETMAHRDWYVVETVADALQGLGLGRIGIGIFNRERQPVCSEDGSLIVFLSGELYDTERLRRDLTANGRRLRDDSDLELVLRLYQEEEEQFIHDLEGAFVLAIWDRARQELIVANDRFGLYPLYYAHHNGKLVFAPEMKGILCDADFRKELNLTALAEYMRFQQLLGEKTFFEGIELLPHASLLRYNVQTDSLAIWPYWDFSRIPEVNVTFEEAVEEIARLLRQAVNRLASGPHRVGVYLSGGLDSRTILGLIDHENLPVTSVTYGQENCRDVVYGERIARKAGSDHHWFEFEDGKWVEEFAGFHLSLTEGFHSWIHAHGISVLPHVRQLTDVNLSGYGGGSVVGGTFTIPDESVDEVAFLCHLFELYNQRHTWPSLSEAEEETLFTDSLYPRLRGVAFSSLAREVSRYRNDSFIRQAEAFKITNHDGRLIHNFLVSNSSHFENACPYYDYRVVEFAYALPPSMKRGKRLLKAVLNRAAPELALVPYDKDNLLVTDRRLIKAGHTLADRLKSRFNRHVYPVFRRHPTLYADYENYLRADLREWGEGILFDKRTLGRGIFKPQFLRSIWARHQSGQELHTIGRIAPIMTYEMMLRRFYD
jgi:asparagine synthase (glutamine-hydrolysing)